MSKAPPAADEVAPEAAVCTKWHAAPTALPATQALQGPMPRGQRALQCLQWQALQWQCMNQQPVPSVQGATLVLSMFQRF